jgi:hypothetical protein
MARSIVLASGSQPPTFACCVAAYGVVEATASDVASLREQPGSSAHRMPPRFLRYADEQTVVGLAAVLRAVDSPPMSDASFHDWGVLAAPQFLGRVSGAATLANFGKTGQAAVSPQFIPQHSLHSVSGAISIALGMGGPNFGVGGGPEALAEGLTVALTFLDNQSVPGLWLVLTQWVPELTPEVQSSAAKDAACWGVAMALTPGAHLDCVLQLNSASPLRAVGFSQPPCGPKLVELATLLAAPRGAGQSSRWSCPMPGGGDIELSMQEQRRLKAA